MTKKEYITFMAALRRDARRYGRLQEYKDERHLQEERMANCLEAKFLNTWYYTTPNHHDIEKTTLDEANEHEATCHQCIAEEVARRMSQ